MSRDTGGSTTEEMGIKPEGTSEKKEIKRPTMEEIRVRAKDIVSDAMALPEKDREWRYSRRLDALDELIGDLEFFSHERGARIDIDEDGEEEPTEDEVFREDKQKVEGVLKQYYPGYTISDIKKLREILPEGVDKAHALSRAAESYLFKVRMKLATVGWQAGDEAEKRYLSGDQKKEFVEKNVAEAIKNLIDDLTVEKLKTGMDITGLLSQLADDDWNFLVKFIKDNRDTPPAKVFETLEHELDKKKS